MQMNINGLKILIERECGSDEKTQYKAGKRIIDGKVFYVPYLCPASIWTQGIGSTHSPDGKPIAKDSPAISEKTAVEWLYFELGEKAATLENWINKNKLSLTANQFSSLLCFAFNLGCGPIIDRERSLNQAILHGGEKEIRAAFGLYVKAKVKNCFGIWTMKTLNGLVIRRSLEANLFFKKDDL